MRHITAFTVCCILAGLLLGLVSCAPLTGAPPGDIAIVANAGVSIGDLSFNELRRIFLGERQFWSSNLRINLLVHAPVARERDVLLRTVYEMSEAQFRQHWIGKVFRSEAMSGPQTFYSDEEIIGALAALPGSIAAVEGLRASPKGLKVIRIDGRLPGDVGYRLH